MATKKEGYLICACQEGTDKGEISISFNYGLEGMGKETAYKLNVLAIGTIADAFEDIKEKLAKIVKKVEKRQRKMHKNKTVQLSDIKVEENPAEDHERTNVFKEVPSVVSLNTANLKQTTQDPADMNSECKGENSKAAPDNKPEEDKNKKSIHVKLTSESTILPGDTLNSEAWHTGNILHIYICGLIIKYTVSYNSPTVDNLQLPNTIMVDYILYPIKADFVRCSKETCSIQWFKSREKPKKKINFAYKQLFFENSATDCVEIQNSPTAKQVEIINKYEDVNTWELIGTGFIYTPKLKDIGYFIKVTCSPIGDKYNCQYSAESKEVVRPDCGPCPFERRHLYTQKSSAEGTFRVLCYNVLADKYANTKLAVDLYYPYCPGYALGLDYRKQLFMKEIIGYNADIICLQEVDQKVFQNDFLPVLGMRGYKGHLKTKAKIISAGVAIFYNQQKFKLVGRHDRECSAALQEDSLHKDLLTKISEGRMLLAHALQAKAMLKVEVFESLECPDKMVLIANTHLKCGQRIPHLRIIQIAVMLKHVEEILNEQYKDKDVSVIVCGDLNSLPESAVIQLLKNGFVHPRHADWFGGGRVAYVSDIQIQTDLKLKAAYENPYFTNYVSCFYGTIDYIFHDTEKLETISTVPLPSLAEVTENTACPSIKMPSDHMALVADFKWK